MLKRLLPMMVMLLCIAIQDSLAQSADTAFWETASQTVDEGDGTITITAKLGSAASGEGVDIPFSFGGTAVRGEDYTYIGAMTLTVLDGDTEVDLVLTLNDDSLVEGEEYVTVIMGEPPSPDWFLGAPSTHTATVTENDEPPATFSVSTQTTEEGDTDLTVTIALSGITDDPTDVSYTFSGSATGSGNDYTNTASPLTIPAGEDESASFTVSIVEDARDEVDETVNITISAGGGGYDYVIGTTASQVITITDDDAPTVQFSSVNVSNSESATSVVVTAEISAQSDFAVTIPLTLGGTATKTASGGKASDFSVPAEEIVIAADATTGTVTFTIVEDALDEPDTETITLEMGSVTGEDASASGQTDFLITIEDNDALPAVDFNSASQSHDESTNEVTVTFDLNPVSGRDVTIPFLLSGTADDGGTDYSVNVSSVVIVEGSTTATAVLVLNDDTIDEVDQTAILTISGPTNATIGGTNPHTVTIEDNDTPTVDFTSASQSEDESIGTLTLTAELAGGTSDWDITVPYTYSGSTAIDPADYSVLPASILITAGNTTNSTTITVVDDIIDEHDEDIVVTMGTPTGGDITKSGTLVHTATIEDNDLPPLVDFVLASQDQDEDVGSFTVFLELDTPSGLDVTIPFTVNGTALGSAVDYSFVPASEVVISAGSTNISATVTVTDDNIDENDQETVVFWMDGVPEYGRRGTITDHTASINDNDLPPLVQMTVGDDMIEPAPGKVSANVTSDLTVTLLSPVSKRNADPQLSGLDVTVTLAFGGDAAGYGVAPSKYASCEGCDYTYEDDDGDGEDDSVSIVIPAGSNSATLSLVAVDDDLFEGGSRFGDEDGQEDIQVAIDSIENGTEDGDQAGVILITDEEDEPTVTLTASPWDGDSSSMNENAGVVTFTATSSHSSEFDITVTLTCTEDSPTTPGNEATCPEGFIDEGYFDKSDPTLDDPDFSVDDSNVIVIEALSTGDDLAQDASITAVDDNNLEANETFNVAISSAEMTTAGDVDTFTEEALEVEIVDDEAGSAPLVEIYLEENDEEMNEGGAGGKRSESEGSSVIQARLLDEVGDPAVSNFDVIVFLEFGNSTTADGDSSTDSTPDFVWDTLNITIPAGATNSTSGVTLTAYNEPVKANEDDEDIYVQIASVDGAEEDGGDGTQQLHILLIDDDIEPTAVDQTFERDEDTRLEDTPLDSGDENVDDTLLITLLTIPENGDVEIFQTPSNGETFPTFEFRPYADWNGTDSFSYMASDGHGMNATAVVSLIYSPTPDDPDPASDQVDTDEDTPVILAVLDNDEDPDFGTLTVVSTTDPDNGTATINPDGTVTYTPDQDFSGTDSFLTTVANESGRTDVSSATITVAPINDAPVGVDDDATTDEDVAVVVDLIGNDTDPDSGSLTISSLGTPTSGSVIDNGDGTVTYTPNPEFAGSDSFTYSVTDGLLSDDALANITVAVVNDPPVAYDDADATMEGETITIFLLSNDTDPESDPLSISALGTPGSGSVVDNGDGSVDYTAAMGVFGTDSFTYSVSDGTSTDDGEVTVTIAAPSSDGDGVSDDTEDDAPNDGDGNDDGQQDSDQQNVTSLPVAEGDSEGEYVTVESDAGTELETVVSGGNPSPSDTPTGATFPVGFLSFQVVLDAPGVTSEVVIYLPEGTTASSYWKYGPTADNATPHWYDFPWDPVTETGAVIDNDAGKITLFFVDGERGDDDMEANGLIDDPGAPVLTENTPPSAVADNYSTTEDAPVTFDPLTNDEDEDGHSFTLLTMGAPSSGTIEDNGDGTFTLTPESEFSGTITVSYTIQDSEGASSSGTITINVNGTNDAPVAVADEGATPEETALELDVVANDTDIDGDVLTVSVVADPDNGTAVVNESGTITYTPDDEFAGTDTFTYTISDGNGGTSTATITITVSGTNDAPVAEADIVTTSEDLTIVIAVLDNDSDAEGSISIQSFTQAVFGLVVDNGDGTLTYTPNADYMGEDFFTYIIVDEAGATAEGQVGLLVMGVNDAPTAEDDGASTAEDTPITIDVMENDLDIDSFFSVTSLTQPANGTVVITDDGTVTYTPNDDFDGVDTFTYTITDTEGLTATATVTIAVGASNDAPVFSAGNIALPSADTIWLGGQPGLDPSEPGGELEFRFPPASDADGDALEYLIEASLSSDFAEVIYSNTTTETTLMIGVLDLLQLLEPQGLAPGALLTVYFRVSVTDPFSTGETLDAVAAVFGRGAFVGSESDELPTEVYLRSNYPNPFNPQTTVEFGLPASMPVTVVVYDLTGRPVQTVVDATLSAGVHRIRIEMDDVPSGAYVYRLITPQNTITKVMHLIK